MIPVLSKDNMQRSDRAYLQGGTETEIELVGRVGRGLADAVTWRAPVAVVCGAGNNGADGLALALCLKERGVAVTAFLNDAQSNACAYYLGMCIVEDVPLCDLPRDASALEGYATVVDCLYGVGFHGDAEGASRDAIDAVNECGAYVVAVDIPSGLDADSGMATTCVCANISIAVGGYKTGHLLNMAADFVGELRNLDIGIRPVARTYHWIEPCDLAPMVAPRPHFCNKGDYGYVALVGGSLAYSGAIRLASLASAAMRAGAGVVKVAVPKGLCPLVVPHILESTLFPLSERDGMVCFDPAEWQVLLRGVRTVAFGMGIGRGEGTAECLSYLLTHFDGTLLVDADGLNALADMPEEAWQSVRPRLVLTPHAKEFARLVGRTVPEVMAGGIPLMEEYARAKGVCLLVKGPTTVVTDGRETYLVTEGAPGMATAGSGDVLSGILSATLSTAEDPVWGTILGAWLNGRAGALAQRDVGDIGMVASDTVAHIAEAIRQLRQ